MIPLRCDSGISSHRLSSMQHNSKYRIVFSPYRL